MIIHIIKVTAHRLHLDGVVPCVAIGQQGLAVQFIPQKTFSALIEITFSISQKGVEGGGAWSSAVDVLKRHVAFRGILLVA